VRCLVQLNHARPCYALVAAALKEAEQAQDSMAAAQLLHAQVGCNVALTYVYLCKGEYGCVCMSL
jgi:hypothetical protein